MGYWGSTLDYDATDDSHHSGFEHDFYLLMVVVKLMQIGAMKQKLPVMSIKMVDLFIAKIVPKNVERQVLMYRIA